MSSLSEQPTHREGDPTLIVENVAGAIEDHGAAFEALPDGTLIATMRPGPDAAVRAVRCALSIRATLGDIPLHVTPSPQAPSPQLGGDIHVDPLLIGLVEQRFELDGTRVIGERSGRDVPRAPRGAPTPFVGRERELALLRALLEDCIHNHITHTVLITGAPGIGKTRLIHELQPSSHVVVLDDFAGELPVIETGMLIVIARESTVRPGVDHIRLGPPGQRQRNDGHRARLRQRAGRQGPPRGRASVRWERRGARR